MTTKEIAKQIRAEFKKERLKNYSVRTECIAVKVRALTEKEEEELRRVKNIISKYERIDRCEITNEVLSGGNIYMVLVNHDDKRVW